MIGPGSARIVFWLFSPALALLILAGCATPPPPTVALAPTATPGLMEPPTPEHGHVKERHEPGPTSGSVAALVLVRRLDGVNSHEGGPGVVGERFGISATADDMDGDRVPDIVVGAPRADVSGSPGTNEGAVFVYSGAALLKGMGAEEALLYRIKGEATTNGTGELGFRQSIATADFDQDGLPELVVGAWLADPSINGVPQVDAGTAFVFSGAGLLGRVRQHEAILFRLDGESGSRLGRPVALVGDMNRDGTPDFFVGAHRASPRGLEHSGSGYLVSGADFSILKRFDGGGTNDFLGRSVMSLGDLNGDGHLDLAIGASQGDGGQAGGIPAGPGYVQVYSGKDYSLLYRLTAPQDEPIGSFGQSTVYTPAPGAGADFNGDGVPDIIVGSPEAQAGFLEPPGGPPGKEGYPRTGSVYVFSGADFSLLYRFNGERGTAQADPGAPSHESPTGVSPAGNVGDIFGDAIAVVPDLDGDGTPEIVIGAPRGDGRNPDGSYPADLIDSGYVKVFSGKRGTLLARFNGAGRGTNMGHHITGVADVNGDGSPDLLIGSDLTDYGGTDAGSLYWYTVQVTSPVE